MTAVSLIRDDAEGVTLPAIWSGYLPLPGTGATIIVDGTPYEVVSHRYTVNTGAVWESPVTVVIRQIPE